MAKSVKTKSVKKPAASRTKASTKKKAPAKKKAVAKKKAPAKKKVAAKKKTAVKTSARKKAAVKKKPVAKKAAVRKKAAVQKKAASKKKAAPSKKAPVKKKPAAKKPASLKKPAPKKPAPKKAAPATPAPAAPVKKKKRTAPTIITKRAVAPRPKPNIVKGPPTKFVPPKVPYASLDAAPVRSTVLDREELPTVSQLKKVKSGLTRKDLNAFRTLLLERRAEIIGDVAGLEAARSASSGDLSNVPLHMADVGSDNYEQEFTLGLMESERNTVVEIDDALQRIVRGTYGVCLISAQPISRPRLEAKPWAKYSIEVARERERRGL